MENQRIFARIKIKSLSETNVDFEQERHKLANMFDQALKSENLGRWSGSSCKSGTLIFYFQVGNFASARDAIISRFDLYEHRSEFNHIKIKSM